MFDARGLFSALQNVKAPKPMGDRGRLAVWLLLTQSLRAVNGRVFWVNGTSMLADCLTKPSHRCSKSITDFLAFLKSGQFLLATDTVSARKAAQSKVGDAVCLEPDLEAQEGLVQ